MFVIDDTTANDLLFPRGFGTGHDPSQIVQEMLSAPTEIPLIPKSEWIPRIRDRKKYKTGLRDSIFKRGKIGPVKDQNGQGYCWFYSVTRSVEYARAIMGLDYVPLSAHSGACVIKNFQNQGGWCGLAAQFIREKGIVPESLWPAKSMSRSYNTEENWKEAEKYKIVEDYVDLTKPVYDQNIPYEYVVSCLLQNIPVVLDYNWWGHSVLGVDLEEIDGQEAIDIDNSWTPGWGDNGTARLQGSRRVPDGAIATRVVNPS